MPDTKPLIPDELLQKVEDFAREQNRETADVVSDAVRKYLREQRWVQFVERNERRALANGIHEEDVDRLISEVRRENAGRGR